MTHLIGRDLCTVDNFATACGLPADDVASWVENGTLPSVKVADVRLINVSRLNADLLSGKESFSEGDYSHG